MKRNAFKKGTTLIEVLVASIILAIVIAPSMLLYSFSHKTSLYSSAAIQANTLLVSEMEYNLTLDGIILETQVPATGKTITGSMYFFEGAVLPYTIKVYGQKINTDPNVGNNATMPTRKGRFYSLRGIITWSAGGEIFSDSLSTYAMYGTTE